MILYKDSTSRLGLTALIDIDGTAVTDANVVATIYTLDNTEVAGQSWPVSLTHEADGNYYASVESDLDIDIGKRYYIEIIAVSGPTQKTWRQTVTCEYAS